MSDSHNGIKEGIARCCSQACIFGIDAHKTLLQVHGYIPKLPHHVILHRWTVGMLTSSLTSGLVFGTYFSVYNRLHDHIMAGTVASLATSVIKIPISNCMRVMQSGGARNIIRAGKKIVRRHTWRGLYTGYFLSLVEDIIEFDLRTRIYKAIKSTWNSEKNPGVGFANGAISGAVVAGLTTPFDTVRSKLITQTTASCGSFGYSMRLAHMMYVQHGITGLYRGVGMRVLSNAIKSALFFSIFELLPDI